MKTTIQHADFVAFSPGIQVEDAWAVYWLQQVTWRLRREVCWLWHERGMPPQPEGEGQPTFMDKAAESLGLHRFRDEKLAFFERDPTAHYLSERMQRCPRPQIEDTMPGSFGWVVHTLGLDGVASFALALGLLIYIDSAAESVIACCLNDPAKTRPTLALAHRLWDDSKAVLSLFDPSHPLFETGLLSRPFHPSHSQDHSDWGKPIHVTCLVAHQLLYPNSSLPAYLEEISHSKSGWIAALPRLNIITSRLKQQKQTAQVIPLMGRKGSHYREIAGAISSRAKRKIMTPQDQGFTFRDPADFRSLLTYCWLKDKDLLLHGEAIIRLKSGHDQSENVLWHLPRVPVSLLLAVQDRESMAWVPKSSMTPVFKVPELTYHQRRSIWKATLGDRADGLDDTIAECSRRFRCEKETIHRMAREMTAWNSKITREDLFAVCRQNTELDLGDLAQRVTPRFDEESLILALEQMAQFQEVVKAMNSLTKVHYQWGTAKVWNESGIAVLFSGPPGTGKTMAAEILAHQLNLPMYRIDLSQVVNKYIGETEKNLKRLFDTADTADLILFFDEADALFGRRTDVKDAHDRYANLEISYLLERMERFKGLAILATNRKKDLDKAFLRRLRYIVDFPIPGERQRKQMWKQMLPKMVDCSAVDIEFLSKQFQFTGGHIRSIIFNACLQSIDGKAAPSERFEGKLSMEAIIVAMRRELEKMNKPLNREQFGDYAPFLRGDSDAEN